MEIEAIYHKSKNKNSKVFSFKHDSLNKDSLKTNILQNDCVQYFPNLCQLKPKKGELSLPPFTQIISW
jgi:hypothetical protein